jgi:glycosyltransferase involved in cell wall biosynthesis
MKIAYLSRGNTSWDRRLLEKMLERGHKPYFISYTSCEKVKVNGIENYHFDYTSMHRIPLFRSFQTALHLKRLLKKIQPDILHTGWVLDMGFFGALSGFRPVLSMPFGSDILLRPDNSLLEKYIARFTLRRADMIYCDCEVVKNKIVKLSGCSPDKIVVFPQGGIDFRIFRPITHSPVREKLGWKDKTILIMTRQFRPVYGIEYFINALPVVIQQRPHVRVILVGAGPLESTYRERIDQLGLNEYIYFAGWVDDRIMSEYLNAADIYVTTSLSDGTSNSMLEAMACGLPLIVSDAPVYFEWVKDGVNGFIVPRRDSSTLARRLIQLIDNRTLQREMGNLNLKIIHDKADWEKNFDQLEDVYSTLKARYL